MIEAQPSVTSYSFECAQLPVSVAISRFVGEGGVEEYHFMIRPTMYENAEVQLDWIHQAYEFALREASITPSTSVLRRFFCSDIANQAQTLRSFAFSDAGALTNSCAISWVGQPPAPPAKIALWAYHVSDPAASLKKSSENQCLSLRRGDLTHLWTTGVTCEEGATSYEQTTGILAEYQACLRPHRAVLGDDVIRTWFFVRDVDSNYQGLVDARREAFAELGLTADTHYIASTGIEGACADVASTVAMDAYAISGVRPEQIDFLSAPDHLSPTHIYGVTFERGTSVSYQDRKHIHISGTASIDRDGRIVHEGDVLRQLERTLENIDALLRNACACLQDASMFIVYVRDGSDIPAISDAIENRLGETPRQIVVAPVCRPGWLIEIECQAIVACSRRDLPSF